MATRTHSSGTRTHTRAPGTCANMPQDVPHLVCGALPQTHRLKGLKRAPRKATKVGFPPPGGRAWPFLLEPSLREFPCEHRGCREPGHHRDTPSQGQGGGGEGSAGGKMHLSSQWKGSRHLSCNENNGASGDQMIQRIKPSTRGF